MLFENGDSVTDMESAQPVGEGLLTMLEEAM